MPETSRYALPFLQAGQAQKEITHNDALGRIDGLIHLAVESRHDAPTVAVEGTAWIVADDAAGDWAGHHGDIALFDDGGWTFIAPRDGCIAFVRDEAIFVHLATGVWRDGWAVASLTIGGRTLFANAPATIAAPDGGSVVDIEARAAIAQLLAALRAMALIT